MPAARNAARNTKTYGRSQTVATSSSIVVTSILAMVFGPRRIPRSAKEPGEPHDSGVRIDPAVRVARTGVRDVLIAVACVDRRALGDEERGADTTKQQK